MRLRWLVCATLLAAAAAVVDEAGRYRPGQDITSLAPPAPSEDDRKAAVDLSKQPVEKLFRLLAYELMREEKRPAERRTGIREFQIMTEMSCQDKLVRLLTDSAQVADEVEVYHLNITGTAGLYWLLHKYPEEHSWVWLLAVSHERVLRKVEQHLLRLSALAADDPQRCLSPPLRSVLMSATSVWRKLHGDYVALLWNGVAFGVLGDVTSWREVDEDGAEPGPGGPPPNVSWSENLIFGNMWVSSVQKWLRAHAQDLGQAVYTELGRAMAGIHDEARWSSWQRSSKAGVLPAFGFLHRQIFGAWPLDKGLLRGLLRHCLRPKASPTAPKASLADFGAGGGRYSEWLNETGLVDAFAFDAASGVEEITGGRVVELDLAVDVQLWRTFEWVLCLDVVASLSLADAAAILRNARAHAERGIVVSWSSPEDGAPSLSEPDALELVERETGFALDAAATASLRRGCELRHLRESVAVFRKAS